MTTANRTPSGWRRRVRAVRPGGRRTSLQWRPAACSKSWPEGPRVVARPAFAEVALEILASIRARFILTPLASSAFRWFELAEATLEPRRSFRQDFDLAPTGDSEAAGPATTRGPSGNDGIAGAPGPPLKRRPAADIGLPRRAIGRSRRRKKRRSARAAVRTLRTGTEGGRWHSERIEAAGFERCVREAAGRPLQWRSGVSGDRIQPWSSATRSMPTFRQSSRS